MHLLHSGIAALIIVQLQQNHHISDNSAEHDGAMMKRKIDMAYAANTQVAPANIFARGAEILATVGAYIERRRVYKQTVRELSALSNRELADLGLSRSMIRSIALEATSK
jgi:uncharacterized protein YjiS (DUF1127 family)